MVIFIVREVLFRRVITTLIELVQRWALIFRKMIHSLFHYSCSDFFYLFRYVQRVTIANDHTQRHKHIREDFAGQGSARRRGLNLTIRNTQN